MSYELTWNGQGRLASRRYTDHTKRVEHREFTYRGTRKAGSSKKIMRDPSRPVGEFYRYEYTWSPTAAAPCAAIVTIPGRAVSGRERNLRRGGG